ncbi:protein of unknown function [Shimia gijangensis]|uniref:DnaJ homologue subfamily C member 28 conserved domain-containing protein n=1 Tax=Shimia gijangensis TaxID=1470563 RepID=A0A1M6HF67_9RHOB|nr:DnaJ family domain-containing protein [Shimia gijangensis]SHJ20783.1 protein of unknown function [Shimia gijangensis]
MTHPFNSIIDMFLSRAEKNGDFSDLPGMGKPLANVNVPKDAVVTRLMTEAKIKPPAVALKQQIIVAQARLKGVSDPEERKAEMRLLSDLQMRLSMELEAYRRYA